MGKKIFISYKYADSNVYFLLRNISNTTVRDYVDEIMEKYLLDSDIYKGEQDDNDLSNFKDDTIASHLKKKIYDSSIIIVLISPNMKTSKPENDQWIPWEISYSLKSIPRKNNRGEYIKSQTNGVVAVILPDRNNNYDYFIKNLKCQCCIEYQVITTFKIIQNNMYNTIHKASGKCKLDKYAEVFLPKDSYVEIVKWNDFIINPQAYINNAEEKRKNIKDYNITKEINN